MKKTIALCLALLTAPLAANASYLPGLPPGASTDATLQSAVAALQQIQAQASNNVGGYPALGQCTLTGASVHPSGTDFGGVCILAIARQALTHSQANGQIAKMVVKSVLGFRGCYQVRVWSWAPTTSTITDAAAFVGSDTDDVNLIDGPFDVCMKPATDVTGDASTYARITLQMPYWNQDSSPTANVYMAIQPESSDPENGAVRITVSGSNN